MAPEQPRQDPQDKAFGTQASRDADMVDRQEEESGAESVPDASRPAPRAWGKAEPDTRRR